MIVLVNRGSSSQGGFGGAVYYLTSVGEAEKSFSIKTEIANVLWKVGQSHLSF